jgi:hypothetical protein
MDSMIGSLVAAQSGLSSGKETLAQKPKGEPMTVIGRFVWTVSIAAPDKLTAQRKTPQPM